MDKPVDYLTVDGHKVLNKILFCSGHFRLSYLGPPFSDPDFSPPRPNTMALSLPSAATRLDLWRSLENRARLAQNHQAYSVLLGAVQELARATLCPYLQSSLLHFSAGLDGLLGSISGLMTMLGYSLPLQYYSLPTGGVIKPEAGAGTIEGGTRREKEGQWAREEGERNPINPRREERRRSEKQQMWEGQANPLEDESSESVREEMREEEGEMERWGARRRLLSMRGKVETNSKRSMAQVGEGYLGSSFHLFDFVQHTLSQMPRAEPQRAQQQGPEAIRVNLTQLLMDEILQHFYSNSINQGSSNVANGNHVANRENSQDNEPCTEQESYTQDKLELIKEKKGERGGEDFPSFTSPLSIHPRQSRSLSSSIYTSTLHPPLSPLSLFYQFAARGGHTLLSDLARGGSAVSPPVPLFSSISSTPLLHPSSFNDFSQKVESFWVLRELQSWLWRSAKDFNRLKKKLRT